MSIIRSCTLEDAVFIAGRLRQEDAAELKAMTGFDPEPGILFCLLNSNKTFCGASDKNEPIAIYGWTPDYHGASASIWFFATDQLRAHRRDFIRTSTQVLDNLNDRYPVLYNSVDARNLGHIRWLKWVGCTITGKRILGVEQRPFLDFIRIKKKHV